MNSVAALFFVVMVAFVPTFANAAMAPRWCVLSVGVPLLLTQLALPTRGPAVALGAAFVAYAAATLLWHPVPWFGALALWQWLLLAGMFCVGANLSSLQPVAKACALGIGVSSVVAVMQVAGWQAVPHVNSPAGLFVNKNTLAEVAGLVLVLVLALRLWAYALPVLPAFALPMCRGAVFGVALAALCAVFRKSFAAGLLCGLALLGAMLWVVNMRPETVAIRLQVWANTWKGVALFGNGVGSFFTLYPLHSQTYDVAVHGRPIQAHNDFLESIFDLGIGAALLFGVLVAALWAGLPRFLKGKRYETEAAAAWFVLVAGMGMACFEFPFRVPASAALVALVAGRLCCLGTDRSVADPRF